MQNKLLNLNAMERKKLSIRNHPSTPKSSN